MVDINKIPIDGVKIKALPVNPSDPIAIVNNQAITRQQLADECVAKEGKKILDTMINRVLIEQALARQKMTVTAAEIDEEIDSIAAAVRHRREIAGSARWTRSGGSARRSMPARSSTRPSRCGSSARAGSR